MARRSLLHRGLRFGRVQHDRRTGADHACARREQAFASEWSRLNRTEEAAKGRSLLQLLMTVRSTRGSIPRDRYAFLIRRRDATIVATIIQWLGSPNGFSFLEHCLKLAGYTVVPTDRYQELTARPRVTPANGTTASSEPSRAVAIVA